MAMMTFPGTHQSLPLKRAPLCGGEHTGAPNSSTPVSAGRRPGRRIQAKNNTRWIRSICVCVYYYFQPPGKEKKRWVAHSFSQKTREQEETALRRREHVQVVPSQKCFQTAPKQSADSEQSRFTAEHSFSWCTQWIKRRKNRHSR